MSIFCTYFKVSSFYIKLHYFFFLAAKVFPIILVGKAIQSTQLSRHIHTAKKKHKKMYVNEKNGLLLKGTSLDAKC